MIERLDLNDSVGSGLILPACVAERFAAPRFHFNVECRRDGKRIWTEDFWNTVMTAGKNDLLDKYFAGSGYTAAWYFMLISSTGYSAIAAADTMASHAGWTEDVNYSNATRVAIAFAAASGGSKATSAGSAFNINGSTTIKGAAVTTGSAKSGTAGILYSAALFNSPGDRVVVLNDVLNVTGTWAT